MIHAGLILLIVGELVTSLYADENNMSIMEGETVSYAEDIREVELAIVDRSDPGQEHVVVVPQSVLAGRDRIRDPLLPFDIEVVEYFPNADLVNLTDVSDHSPIADRGAVSDLRVVARARPVTSGVDRDQSDLPAAYITLNAGGQRLGTWLVSLYFSLIPNPISQEVVVGQTTYVMTLRHKRAYKPYEISLVDFRHDRYLGTETPMNYSSDVRLVDARNGTDRQVHISMNNPLRYRGETFYQSSFMSGDRGTVLQVVRNPGWLLPYIACAIGGLGLSVHFGMSLSRFLRRERRA
jgi:hypothetical protein